ncbi:hypothetical protein KBC03_05660, partial [Patescibacteria group bacterium]|nr:hypothetical protein [Patescibacteria group bacterium]
MPSDGIYTFIASDQGIKTFSKGLVVKKTGTFVVKVSEIINEGIKGNGTLTVKGGGDSTALGTISISSPSVDSTETNRTINVVGNSSLKNSPLQLYINGAKVKEDLTSANGDFNVYISNVQQGSNMLQAKIVDVDGKEVAVSPEIKFLYQPAADVNMQGFEILPGNTVKQGQKVTFVFHANDAKSVQLNLVPADGSAIQKVILDNIDPSTWKKEALMDKAGTYSVNATMNANGTDKALTNIGSLSVVDAKSVQQVKYFVDNVDKTK